ncbi:MAG: AAA family ATPase, partial [Mycobacteriales bacterium]
LHDARLQSCWGGRGVDIRGDGATGALRHDPWRLLDVGEVTLADADRFARTVLGELPRDDLRRGQAIVVATLRTCARNGNTVVPVDVVAGDLVAAGVSDPGPAVAAACGGRAVIAASAGADAVLALERYAAAEEAVAEAIGLLADSAEPLSAVGAKRRRPSADADRGDDQPGPEDLLSPGAAASDAAAPPDTALATSGAAPADTPVDAADAELDEAQRRAVHAALEHGVSVLTGGPGTGKSRTVAAVVRLAKQRGKDVALAAPTGRAARRLAEFTDAPTATLHRLLGAQPGPTHQPTVFTRGADCPVEADLIVIDEVSMLDVELAAALFEACAEGTHVLLVGDAAQLPSIGPGRVLADILDSGTVPVTELTTLYRQDAGGAIARLATACRGGELPPIESPDREVVVVPIRSSLEGAHRVRQLVLDSIPRALGIPPDAIQVVTPVHRGPAGTIELNKMLKAQLNPGGGTVRGFDIGDRVVATANHLDAEPAGYANGEIGIITAAGGKSELTVEFASGPATIAGRALGDLVHGWAITVHRAQGSEWPAVVAVFPPEAGNMLTRPLVYTALTRARRHLSVVPMSGPQLAHAVRTRGAVPRRTRLAGLLSDAVPE